MPREKHKNNDEDQDKQRSHTAPKETREATEPEIDEAVDESFPASDPPALHLEKDR